MPWSDVAQPVWVALDKIEQAGSNPATSANYNYENPC